MSQLRCDLPVAEYYVFFDHRLYRQQSSFRIGIGSVSAGKSRSRNEHIGLLCSFCHVDIGNHQEFQSGEICILRILAEDHQTLDAFHCFGAGVDSQISKSL